MEVWLHGCQLYFLTCPKRNLLCIWMKRNIRHLNICIPIILNTFRSYFIKSLLEFVSTQEEPYSQIFSKNSKLLLLILFGRNYQTHPTADIQFCWILEVHRWLLKTPFIKLLRDIKILLISTCP